MFYNRNAEREKLEALKRSPTAGFAVIYGRRRCGKSTLLQETMVPGDVYHLATQGTPSVQRQSFARTLSRSIRSFDVVDYPSWEVLFQVLNERGEGISSVIIDEFPYWVKSDTGLPSVLQALMDQRATLNFNLILCGSSQQMMGDLVLAPTAPLYGRADEIIKIRPLAAGWLTDHLPTASPEERVIEYAIWGGVPRYWDLRANYPSLEAAVTGLIFDPIGLLYEEPIRLLVDDLRDTAQPVSLLAIVAAGANRLSEIAGRMQRPASDLSRPLNRLIQLGYLRKEVPYGGKAKDRKRALYRMDDPFMRFYYRFVYPNLTQIERGLGSQLYQTVSTQLPDYVASMWEQLCALALAHGLFGPGYYDGARWWGNGSNGQQMEIDVVCYNQQTDTLLVVECKWSTVTNEAKLRSDLLAKARSLPLYRGGKITAVIAARAFAGPTSGPVMTPTDVLSVLRY